MSNTFGQRVSLSVSSINISRDLERLKVDEIVDEIAETPSITLEVKFTSVTQISSLPLNEPLPSGRRPVSQP